MAYDCTKLLKFKRLLYHELLLIPVDEIRDCDIHLGYELVKDPDIQNVLNEKINP